MYSNTIKYYDYKPSSARLFFEKVENAIKLPTEHIQRGLLIMAIGCAILCLIPHVGFAGALSLRSVVVLMVGVKILDSMKKKEDVQTVLLQIFRLASVILGLTGVALHSNLFIITSLAGEILYQGFETIRGIKEKDPYKALSHSAFIILDTLFLAGMVTGAWPFIVSAAAVSALVMFIFAGKTITMGIIHKDYNAIFDSICYIALGCIGIASAVRAGKLYGLHLGKAHFFYKNNTDHTVTIYDKSGHVIAKVDPGDSISFNLSRDDMYHGGVQIDAGKEGSILKPDSWLPSESFVLQDPMSLKDFPTLPVGSTLVTEDARVRKRNKDPQTIDFSKFDAFLNPNLGEPKPCFLLREDAQKLIIRFRETEKKFAFDLKAICEVSGYLKRWIELKKSTKGYRASIEFDEPIFDQLIQFFYHGTLTGLDDLNERDLLDLYDAADYLEIEGLRLLCQKEIAIRLTGFKWEKTDLLQQYTQEERSLSPLIKLFNFN